MKTKKISSIIVTMVAIAIGYVVSNPIIFHICRDTYQFNDYVGCLDSSIKNIGSPLLTFSLWALLIVVVTAFFSEEIFRSWLKLAIWAVPLSFIFVALVPVNSSGAYLDLFPFYRDDAARLAGGVFAAASLILIAWKWFRSRA